jgi:hypothetical protein
VSQLPVRTESGGNSGWDEFDRTGSDGPAVEVLPGGTWVTRPISGAGLVRIEKRDPDGWPILATAMAFDCPVWTEGQDIFGAGVPTWTTDRVEIYLTDYESD